MATVTFPNDLGGDGLTVTDDANPETGLAAGGHRLRFVPALSNSVAMARTATDKAALAQQLADQTAADRAQTGQDRDAIAGAKDATAADRVQTGKDAAAASASKAAAANSASAAKTSETNAAASESAAKNSESGAATARQSATNAASAAAGSASAAKDSETAAANSASSASSSKTAAANSASSASSSKTAAANSAAAAANSAAQMNADDIMHRRGSGLPNEVGTAATRDVGTADGQLMEVGVFGLGDKSLKYVNYSNDDDFLTVAPGAIGNNGSSSTPSNAPGPGRWGGMKFGVYHAGIMFLRGDSQSSNIRALGWGFNNKFEAGYRTLIDSKNVVGPVGSGLPGVIESGENSNGRYVKYADGTLLCWVRGVDISYYNSQTIRGQWNFPYALIDRNYFVDFNFTGANGSGAPPDGYRRGVKYIPTDYTFCLPGIITSNDTAKYTDLGSAKIDVFAIGRWS